ncbi:vascular endothelial growth factor C-like [Actinia tenebrosa]|uniref:Vascular endothelial growth factor C-like n=1 Tax=Actinia tenebrosa TaxID=6105 RepID=A0A6P8I9V2_ACTTE|nr:vascular endothelial growth factor C-like [Actinia tenebrosa]
MKYHLVLLLLVPLFCGSDAVVDAQFCNPHPTLVPIDHPNYGYFPYFVKLHRCGGSCHIIQPSIKSCVATETKNVTVDLFDITKKSQRTIQLVNHTQCGCQCVAKPSDCTSDQVWKAEECSCVCKYTHRPPPTSCPEGHRWDSGHCECRCDKPPKVCPVGKHWSPRACGCVCSSDIERSCRSKGMITDDECECKVIDLEAKKGDEPKDEFKINKLMLVLMIGEFALMFFVFDAILYHKKAGLMHSIVKRCKGQTKDEAEEQKSNIRNSYEVSSVSTKEDFVENV